MTTTEARSGRARRPDDDLQVTRNDAGRAQDPGEDAPTQAPPRRTSSRSPLGWVLRLFGLPVFLAVVCAALYLYVESGREENGGAGYGSIEARFIDRQRLTEAVQVHVELVLVSTLLTLLVAVPAGILLSRRGRISQVVGGPVLAVANIGQAVPSFGVLALLAVYSGIGFGAAFVGLFLYALLPILRNTIVGLQQVDESVVEAARGMGLSRWQVLQAVELPLAVPVALAGVRTALVINVGTATVATLIGAGGLGDIVYGGIKNNRDVVLVIGAVMTGVLALTVDHVAGLVEEWLTPRGL